MKKILCLLVVFTILFSFASCGNKNGGNSSSAASSALAINENFVQYAEKGEIFGLDFEIGTSVDEIKKYYHYEDTEYWSNQSGPSGVDDELMITSDDINVRMATNNTRYYYKDGKKENGISFIAYFGDSYDYHIGQASIQDVRNTAGIQPASEGDASAQDVFFFPGEPEGMYKIQYVVGDYTVAFYFNENVLAATTICNQQYWSLLLDKVA